MQIIDAHSHIGEDFFQGIVSLDEYVELMKNSKINAGLLMSVPCPVYYEDGEKKKYLEWEFRNGEFVYKTPLNPFKEANDFVYNSIKRNNSDIRLFYVMMIHPIFDTIKYLRDEIEKKKPVALKMHGLGSAISAENMNESLTQLIKEYDIPIIVHTDYDDCQIDIPYSLQYVRNINNARYWAEYFHTNQIRGILNHGCALDPVACEIVNNSPYLKVALGPDYINNQEVNRLNADRQEVLKKGYLRLLREKLLLTKILFDVDFNWNEKLDSDEMDLEFVDRVKAEWSLQSEQELIFAENLVEHIPVLRKKL